MRLALAVLVAVALGGCDAPAPARALPPLPAPSLRFAASEKVTASTLCLTAATQAAIPTAAEHATLRGLRVATSSCALTIEVALDTATPPSVPAEWSAHADGFAWALDGATLTIHGATRRALHLGLHALLDSLPAAPVSAADWPAFPSRGVIEGFYGPYFSHADRLTTLRLLHATGLSTYWYTPKLDRFASSDWAEPYPTAIAAELAETTALARALDLDFIWGISPTLSTSGQSGAESSIEFSSEADVQQLLAKLTAMRALGVERFALLYDDTSGMLVHAADRAAFATIAEAHAALANRVFAETGLPLVVVGVRYHGMAEGWQDYNRELGQRLATGIDVIWTGPSIFSTTIAASDLTEINLLLGRQVVIWDNWPLDRSPITGRSADLYTASPSLLLNAAMVGEFQHPIDDFWGVLGTLADYTKRPEQYAPQPSFDAWQPLLTALLPFAKRALP